MARGPSWETQPINAVDKPPGNQLATRQAPQASRHHGNTTHYPSNTVTNPVLASKGGISYSITVMTPSVGNEIYHPGHAHHSSRFEEVTNHEGTHMDSDDEVGGQLYHFDRSKSSKIREHPDLGIDFDEEEPIAPVNKPRSLAITRGRLSDTARTYSPLSTVRTRQDGIKNGRDVDATGRTTVVQEEHGTNETPTALEAVQLIRTTCK